MRKVTECLSPYTSTVVVNKRHSKVHGEGLSLSKSNLAGSTPSQNLTVCDELIGSNRLIPCNQDSQVQCQSESYQGNQDGSVLADLPESRLHDGVPYCPYPRYNHQVRFIQHRLGNMSRGNLNRKDVVKERVF